LYLTNIHLLDIHEELPISRATLTRSEKKVKRVPIRYLKALIKANKVMKVNGIIYPQSIRNRNIFL